MSPRSTNTLGVVLAQAIDQLTNSGIITARLDCLVLLEDITGMNRAAILAHPEHIVSAEHIEQLETALTRRCLHEPLAYIRGHASFYGREFLVNRHVLVPRPESETMIDLLKSLPLGPNPRIADIGTGSGALGITAAHEVSGSQIDLYDLSSEALAVAQTNSAQHNVLTACQHNNLLDGLTTAYSVLLANLPYVPQKYPINQAAQHEPAIALFAGDNGLQLYDVFWKQIAKLQHHPDFILCESFPDQQAALTDMAQAAGYRVHALDDFISVFVKR